MPRNRSAKVAVLGSAAQRSQTAQYSRSTGPVRRRIVVAVLVVLSLALITVYFRESDSGALHGVQSAGATVLRPFEIAAKRVAQPFEDAYGYVSDMIHAKSKVDDLERKNAELQAQAIANAVAAARVPDLERQLNYVHSPRFPDDYRPITTSVLSSLPNAFGHVVTIDAGRANGVRMWAPVTVKQGLVGQVTGVTRHTAQVTLLVDGTSNVAARDVSTTPGATGLVRHAGSDEQLIFDRVQKDLDVREGDKLVTAGSSNTKLPSEYPANIPIGTVAGVRNNDVAIYKQIQVDPFVDFSSLESVVVLVPKDSQTP